MIRKSFSYIVNLAPDTAIVLALLIGRFFLLLARFKEVGKYILIGLVLATGIWTLISVISETAVC